MPTITSAFALKHGMIMKFLHCGNIAVKLRVEFVDVDYILGFLLLCKTQNIFI